MALTSSIDGATRLIGVLGWPIAHTRSPRMQNAAFAVLGLNLAYVPLAVPSERLQDAARGLAALGFVGANVTTPHKAAILPFLSEATPIVQALGAANTLLVQADGTLYGDNTDAYGFMADLKAHGVAVGRDLRALVIGAGGAARSVVYALAEAGAAVTVVNRTPEHADEVIRIVCAALPGASGQLTSAPFPSGLAGHSDADLVVNATSLGLHPESDSLPWDASIWLHPGQLVYDLVYGRTPFQAFARKCGARTVDGLGMLVHQGARAAALWTGEDEERLAQLMREELERQ